MKSKIESKPVAVTYRPAQAPVPASQQTPVPGYASKKAGADLQKNVK